MARGGDSWGAWVLAITAKHPLEVLTCLCAIITGAFVFLWKKIDRLENRLEKKMRRLEKKMRKQSRRTRKYMKKQAKKILSRLGQSSAGGDSGAGAGGDSGAGPCIAS